METTEHKIKRVKNRYGTMDKYYRGVRIYEWHGRFGGKGWCVKVHSVRNDTDGNYEPYRHQHSAYNLNSMTRIVDDYIAEGNHIIEDGFLMTPSYQTWEKAQREQRRKKAELAREKAEQDDLERLRRLSDEQLAQALDAVVATVNRINKVIQEKKGN